MATDKVSWGFVVTGLVPMVNSMEKVAAPIGDRTMTPLNKVALKAFAATTNDVHVITGKLRASGRLQTTTTKSTWRMRISYGGRKKSPAYYAIYELNRAGIKPGFGPHDFFAGIDTVVEEGVDNAIDSHFAPLKGKLK